ncbi:hypothetical protein A6A03_11465 [Chloroflexus islandicus]|uniref:Glycerophosphoryl diester phosphodiesterase membrane domain-containing protein n=1 Tax=Chloroflexus islandicus TaxID=1707952 RepID=A0A178MFM8_9CHLR|nr:hypothetical protein [Chloroflexus islandicus]OAN46918.1 hypothetical protein A6A03_11465 [Chloroflexus islandicus]
MPNPRRLPLQEAINLLDEGVNLYRRYLSTFALLAALFSLPALIVTFNLLFSLGDLEETFFEDLFLILAGLLFTSLLMIPPLTRATRMAVDGQPPSLRSVLWRWPQIGRWLIASMYGGAMALVWVMIMSSVSGVLMFIAFCVLIAVVFVTSTALSTSALIVFLPLIIIAGLIAYFLYLVLSASGLVAALYSIQPIIDDTIPIGFAFKLSWSLLFRRFSYNVLVFACAALLFSVLAVIVTLTIAVLLPAPFGLLFGAEHPLTRGLSAVAWVIGLTAAMPLLPIWSTLHYRQMLAERNGVDLARRIQQAAHSEVRLAS